MLPPGNHHKKEDSLIDLSEDYMKQSQPEPDLPVARLNPVQEEPYPSAAWNQNSQESSAGVATTYHPIYLDISLFGLLIVKELFFKRLNHQAIMRFLVRTYFSLTSC